MKFLILAKTSSTFPSTSHVPLFFSHYISLILFPLIPPHLHAPVLIPSPPTKSQTLKSSFPRIHWVDYWSAATASFLQPIIRSKTLICIFGLCGLCNSTINFDHYFSGSWCCGGSDISSGGGSGCFVCVGLDFRVFVIWALFVVLGLRYWAFLLLLLRPRFSFVDSCIWAFCNFIW
ncbi:hypothetical protein PRUPE_1G202300 [Prunus persica]|uniref:Transmembrane protein n=1 Tax=Prunus persica TaxID=3760 RepID=A0A251R0G4_PRUPE|nr:hypothetical protein PRUPE_1G202300 [Prunus persica]